MLLSPLNGGSPVSISKASTPREYRSERASVSAPEICSGERYAAVPMTTLLEVARDSATARTRPKSASLTAPVVEIRTFSGLMSR